MVTGNWKLYSSGYMLGSKAFLMRSGEWWVLVCGALEIEEERFALIGVYSDEEVQAKASKLIQAKADEQIKKIRRLQKLAGG